jgi:hypothetical protein
MRSGEFLRAFAELIRDIINNDLPQQVLELFTTSKLIAIGKDGGGVRPIAIGELALKVAGQYLLELKLPEVNAALNPIQRGFAKRGCESIVHELRSLTRSLRGNCVITLDAKNAFNCIFRASIAAGLKELGLSSCLGNIFTAAYSRGSRLIVSAPDGVKHILKSTRGSRQGDSLGGAFFAIGLHPILKRLTAKFQDVIVLAYMDDVTIFGAPEACVAFVREYRKAIAEIGLELNNKKSHVYRSEWAAEQLRTEEGDFPNSEDGIKVLGAWIGERGAEAFAQECRKSHELFFDRIACLPPHAAIPILQSAATPKWNYLTRVMIPETIRQATTDFDSDILQCFCKVAGINISRLTKEQLMLIHLPVRDGGFGITAFRLLLDGNYAASVDPSSDQQKVRTEQTNDQIKEMIDSSSVDWARHRKDCAKSGAGHWLRPRKELRGEPSLYTEALRMRLRYVEDCFSNKTQCICTGCGKRFEPLTYKEHVLGCATRPGDNVSSRHDAVNFLLADFANTHGIKAVLERAFPPSVIDELRKENLELRRENAQVAPRTFNAEDRPDVCFEFADSRVYVDSTALNTAAPSNSNQAAAERSRRVTKVNKYDAACRKMGGEFIVLQFDVLGGISPTFRKFLKRLTDAASEKYEFDERAFRVDLAWCIQRGNARILAQARREATA